MEEVCLKLNIQKIKIMAYGSITSWQIDGETMETVTDFIFLCSKIPGPGVWDNGLPRGCRGRGPRKGAREPREPPQPGAGRAPRSRYSARARARRRLNRKPGARSQTPERARAR